MDNARIHHHEDIRELVHSYSNYMLLAFKLKYKLSSGYQIEYLQVATLFSGL